MSQGALSTDEMCVFIGSYYPRDDELQRCGGGGLAGMTLGSGEMNGAEFMQCFLGGEVVVIGAGDDPNRYRTQRCFTDACPAVSALATTFLRCLAKREGLEACQEERAAVQTATCD